MASRPVQNITRKSGFIYALHPQAGISLFLPLKRLALHAVSGALARSAFSPTQTTLKTDHAHRGALAHHSTAKKIFRRSKSHYTAPACGFWIVKIFSGLFFYKPDRQPAPLLAALRKTRTEKIEKNFSIFHFWKIKIITGDLVTG
ncbi:hypothetical protein [Enterobacter cancerogenus]|uniref:hypothetical protein n=1 Tax=Enterobacter cancerogenus TaxID=69218 RepID=UPI001FD46D94|nr:hypothetical protein [Enterobacter cancerogenus]